MPRLAAPLPALVLGALLAAGPAAAREGARPAPRERIASADQFVPPAAPRARPSGLPRVSVDQAGFEDWLSRFRGRALARGLPVGVVDAALSGLEYDREVIGRDRNQTEFTKTIWEYLDVAVSETRVADGRAAMTGNEELLAGIEAEYGVDREVVVAIWGLESAYGTFKGTTDIVEALATLAHDGRRGRFFETQLVAALKIIEAGDVDRAGMTGSWAGAMGHTQFIPTSYLVHAVDFTGDGARDIWGEDPADALASTAAYLAQYGWEEDQPWGVEVRLPEGFDYALARRPETRMPSDWARIGVVGTDGAPVADHAPASVLLPAGAQGAAFLIFPNFHVLERYNTADAYVIGVGHLADRIAGGPPIAADWPREDRALTREEREELQRRLTRAGFDTQGVDGRIGPLTIAAVRAFQREAGMVPDGYASLRVLSALREG
jgi:membrane-bound lytic murein transglycosylase B